VESSAGPEQSSVRMPRWPRRAEGPRRRRRGWTLLLIGVAALLVVYVVPTPWALHIGGRFTPLRQWDGYGTVDASNGGRYVLFTHLSAGLMGGGESRSSCSFLGCDTLHGSAKLCTESGQTYAFTLTGAVHSWWSTDGARTNVDLTGNELPDGWVVAFRGVWHGPLLLLADTDNSFTEVFTRAGAIRHVTSTADAGTAGLTLHNGTGDAFSAACAALAARRR
jgi:hypothetical protein